MEEEPEIISNAAEKYAKWSIILQISPWLGLIVLEYLSDNGLIPKPGGPIGLIILTLPIIGGIFSFMALIKAGSEEPPIKKRYVILIVLSAIHVGTIFFMFLGLVLFAVMNSQPQI